jgi:hypothetical protein
MASVTKDSLKLFGLVVAVILVLVGGSAVVDMIKHPFGLGKNALPEARAQAKAAGQQADINASGAAINDSRAANITRIHKTAQEARHAVQQTADHDARLRQYLDGIDRVRSDGAAAIADDPADGGGHDALR